ncbi:hypothetical protein LZ31DRAFT_120720 [Colletotrichum somersetense]|nr:hypothetical protein LZ31DRAFT_120720 [Colletotrichum somersetense]
MPSSIITHDPSIHPSASSARRHTVGVYRRSGHKPRTASEDGCACQQTGRLLPSVNLSVPSCPLQTAAAEGATLSSSLLVLAVEDPRCHPRSAGAQRHSNGAQCGCRVTAAMFQTANKGMFQYLRTVLGRGGRGPAGALKRRTGGNERSARARAQVEEDKMVSGLSPPPPSESFAG